MERLTRYSWLRGALSLPVALACGCVGVLVCAGSMVMLSGDERALAGIAAGPLFVSAVVDAKRYVLPDPLLATSALLLVVVAAWYAKNDSGALIRSGILAGGCVYIGGYVVHRFTSMGLGDVKLLGVIGLWLADVTVMVGAVALASISAACHGGVARLRSGGGAYIPLGPHLIAAACLAWVACWIFPLS
ncbi:prepilin peptidase [Arcanobacterium haemolyticum]|nr:prepilin peptidase [Arcanobacterium haemolyticum]